MEIANLKAKIKTAFASVEPPPHWCLTDSNEGEEPALLQQEFAEIPHWNSLSPTFPNQTPDGYGSALSFFSAEAFRYYLPAFLLTDLDNTLNGPGLSFPPHPQPRRFSWKLDSMS